MIKALLLLLNAGKLGKVLLTSGTMLISVIAYSWIFGWLYAVGFVVLIFIHEMGHYIAARQQGLNVGAPTFIPFLGAWISMKEMPRNAEVEAYVGMGGPLVGSAGALACYFAGRYFGSDLLLALSYAGFFINLFNLIPLSPLDGGRISAAISPKLWLAGVPILIGLFFYRPSPLLILIAILAAPQVWKVIRGHETEEERAYYVTSAETRFSYGLTYIALAGFLAIMCHDLSLQLPRAL
jgi:Zn-dependent protease